MSFSWISSSEDGVLSSRGFVFDHLEKLQKGVLTPAEIATLLEHTYNLLSFSSKEEYINLGLSAICHTAENLPQDSMVQILLMDCISACSNFLYAEMLFKRYELKIFSDAVGVINSFRREFYRTPSGMLLTKQQHNLLNQFSASPRLVVSAPTSFGKTRLLQEIIVERKYERIAIVMPTIALIAETVRRFRADERFDSFPLVNSTSIPVGGDKFILILTPEKLDLLLDTHSEIAFQFFAMDEIYKIQDDDRKSVFANVLYRLSRTPADFYLIGPYFKQFSQRFLAKTSATFRHYSLEIVQKDELRLYEIRSDESFVIDGISLVKAKTDITNLKRIVVALKSQQIIYNSTKRGTESLANTLADLSVRDFSNALISYISENISPEWTLVFCLSRGVAFHHGAMPRYIQAELVEAFNQGLIATLVCTTTLTEGVNTTAKNVIIYSNKKGEESLTGFDYKNLKGRAGRFLHHFVGRVISFYPSNEAERELINFHYLDDEELESEEVIAIEENDLRPPALAKRIRIIETLALEGIPLELIRKNKYISVEKQIVLISQLRRDPMRRAVLAFQGNLPSSATFDAILDMLRDYLFNKHDFDDRNFSSLDLKRLTKHYVYNRPKLKEFIASQGGKSINTKIRKTFYLISHYFEFSFPKYLTCLKNLYEFAVQEAKESHQMQLSYVITMLQYGFSEPHEIALKDAGLPDELITKISQKLSHCRSLEEIRLRVRFSPEIISVLTEFERQLFKKVI